MNATNLENAANFRLQNENLFSIEVLDKDQNPGTIKKSNAVVLVKGKKVFTCNTLEVKGGTKEDNLRTSNHLIRLLNLCKFFCQKYSDAEVGTIKPEFKTLKNVRLLYFYNSEIVFDSAKFDLSAISEVSVIDKDKDLKGLNVAEIRVRSHKKAQLWFDSLQISKDVKDSYRKTIAYDIEEVKAIEKRKAAEAAEAAAEAAKKAAKKAADKAAKEAANKKAADKQITTSQPAATSAA